ncbi:MAG: divergent PAP2 family protein [Clostridiales bacterium]|nr:divergent PAP2 family protein [Clostridiales bacterium]
MDFFSQLANNNVVAIVFVAFILAQGLKVIIILIQTKKFNIKRFVGSGGMPSSHSSTVMALTTCIGRIYGVSSPLFAVVITFAIIVMYDATGVRRAAGRQAEVLNKMIERWDEVNNEEFMQGKLKELIGHTPFQVFAGAILGIFIGMAFPI